MLRIRLPETVFMAWILWWIWSGSQWLEGGQDSWNHYLYARHSFEHPELLLDQWAKTIYTALVAPFTMVFGIKGSVVFNIICTICAGLYTAAAARNWGFKNERIVLWLTVFCPVLFGNTVSSLTEPLNALLLALMLYLFSGNRYTAATILGSFLPFVRSEGYVILAAVALFLIVEKRWKLLLLLPAGMIAMSLFAGIITGDWAWLITGNPYIKFETKGGFDPGSGPFLHYFHERNAIAGRWLWPFLMLGGFILFLRMLFLAREKEYRYPLYPMFFLTGGIFAAYFLAHSFIWYAGMMGSHGLIRVFAVVAPCMALLIAVPLEYGLENFIRNNRAKQAAIALICLSAAAHGMVENRYHKPERGSFIQRPQGYSNYVKAVEWLNANHLQDSIIVHQLPWINVRMNKDPFASDCRIGRTLYLWSLDLKNDWLPVGSVIVYDGYHARRDGFLDRDSLEACGRYQLLTHLPDSSFGIEPAFKGHFDIWIYRKIKN